MSNKLKLLVDFIASTSASPTNSPSNDSTRVKIQVEESNFSELSRQQFSVPNSTTDQSIVLVDSSCEYLMIFVDQQVSIKLNGSSTALILKPKAAGSKTPAFLLRGTITSLSVSNASGSAANLDIVSVNL